MSSDIRILMEYPELKERERKLLLLYFCEHKSLDEIRKLMPCEGNSPELMYVRHSMGTDAKFKRRAWHKGEYSLNRQILRSLLLKALMKLQFAERLGEMELTDEFIILTMNREIPVR